MRQASRTIFTLAAVLGLAAAGCGGDGKGNPAGPGGPAADVTINIFANNGSSSFAPNPDTVLVGQTVAWKNTHSMTHTATADGGSFDTGNISPGATSAAKTMSTLGSFPYHCEIHNGMVGTLVVK